MISQALVKFDPTTPNANERVMVVDFGEARQQTALLQSLQHRAGCLQQQLDFVNFACIRRVNDGQVQHRALLAISLFGTFDESIHHAGRNFVKHRADQSANGALEAVGEHQFNFTGTLGSVAKR